MGEAFTERMKRFDERAMRASMSLRNPFLTALMIGTTYSGTTPVWLGVLFLMLVFSVLAEPFRPTLLPIMASMLGALFSLIVGQIGKRVFKRPRPYELVENLEPAIPTPIDHSMPSTHASTAIALFVGLWMLSNPYTWPVGAWAILVVFSRFYLGVHFPSDLLVGMGLGVFFGLFSPLYDLFVTFLFNG